MALTSQMSCHRCRKLPSTSVGLLSCLVRSTRVPISKPQRIPPPPPPRFSLFKEKDGGTLVHRNSCTFIGQRGKHSSGCPLRLSYNTVVSYIGKLGSIFHIIGRDGE